MPRDDFESSLQPLQCSRARQLPLRENTNDLTTLNLCGGAADRFAGTPAIDRDHPRDAQNRVQNSISIKFFVDNEADRPRATKLEHDGVDPCDMVGNE